VYLCVCARKTDLHQPECLSGVSAIADQIDSNREFERLAGLFSTVGTAVHHLEMTTSTMDVVWQLARDGAADGTVVVADHQSAGRGRYDRSWESVSGQDILCSVLLRPRVALAGELLLLAALAVADVADSLGINAGIKWPNDVQVAGKKLAGVIAESRTGPDTESGDELESEPDRIAAVIGIGLNVNFDPAQATVEAPNATSLSEELGRQVDRLEVFELLMRSLDTHYSLITAGGTVVSAWREKLTTLGREVTVVSGKTGDSTSLRGLAHDVDSIGRLIVRDENGRDWPVSAGEVTVKDIR